MIQFFKTHKLRYLFYISPLKPFKYSSNNYKASGMCKTCKKGVSTCFGVFTKNEHIFFCPHGNHRYIETNNTNLNHKIYVIWRNIVPKLMTLIEYTHILRATKNRYGVFADEVHYTKNTYYSINYSSNPIAFNERKRRWYEYFFVIKHK